MEGLAGGLGLDSGSGSGSGLDLDLDLDLGLRGFVFSGIVAVLLLDGEFLVI